MQSRQGKVWPKQNSQDVVRAGQVRNPEVWMLSEPQVMPVPGRRDTLRRV